MNYAHFFRLLEGLSQATCVSFNFYPIRISVKFQLMQVVSGKCLPKPRLSAVSQTAGKRRNRCPVTSAGLHLFNIRSNRQTHGFLETISTLANSMHTKHLRKPNDIPRARPCCWHPVCSVNPHGEGTTRETNKPKPTDPDYLYYQHNRNTCLQEQLDEH